MEHQIFNVDKETPVSLSIKTGLFSDLIKNNQYFNTECDGLKLGELYVAAHTPQEQNDPTEENPNTYYSGGTLVINTGRGPMFITNKPGPLYKPLVGMGDNVSPSYSNILHLGENGSSGQLSIFGTGNYKANIKYPNTRTSAGGQDSNIELPTYEGLSKIAWIRELADNKGTFDSVGSLNWPVFVNADGELRPCDSVLGSPDAPFTLFYTGAIALLDKSYGSIRGRLYIPNDSLTVLELGNDAKQAGQVQLYGDNGGYTIIKNREGKSINATFYLPPNGAQDTYAIWTAKKNDTIEVGSTTWPIYIDANGQAKPISNTLGATNAPFSLIYSSKFQLQQSFAAQGDNVEKNVICGTWQVSGTNNASTIGVTKLILGNTITRNSTTPNKLVSCPRSGVISLHSTYSNKPTNIQAKEKVRNANAHFILPDGTTLPNCKCYGVWGAASTVTDNEVTGSGIGNTSHPVYMDSDGQLLACETIATTLGGSGLTNPEANRLYFYELDTDQNGNSFIKSQQTVSNHYVDADTLIIGDRTAFDAEDIPTGLQVNTNALFNQKLVVTNAFSIGESEIKGALNKSILGQDYLVLRNLDLDTYNALIEKISNSPTEVTSEEYDLVNNYKQIQIKPTGTDINTDSFTVKTNYVESNSFNEFSMKQTDNVANINFKSVNNDGGFTRTISGVVQPKFGDGLSSDDAFYLQNEIIYPADPVTGIVEEDGTYKYLSSFSMSDYFITLKSCGTKYEQNKWNQQYKSEININTDIDITSTGNINLKESSMQIVKRAPLSSSWWNGRDYAMVKLGFSAGYTVLNSLETATGTWDVGQWTHESYPDWHDRLIFTFFANDDYEYNTTNPKPASLRNSPAAQIWFSSYGDIGSSSGDLYLNDGNINLTGDIYFTAIQKEADSNLPAREESNFHFSGSNTVTDKIPISFLSNPSRESSKDGIAIRIGAGGAIYLGSGESSANLLKALYTNATGQFVNSWAADAEQTYISSDGLIHLVSECQTIDNRHDLIITQGTICVEEVNNETGSYGYGPDTPTKTTGVVKGQVYFKIIE